MADDKFKHYIFGEDAVFDEKGNQFLALRKVQWDTKDNGKDESKAKLELRKWVVNKDMEEVPNKGFAFLTEDGPHNLAELLVDRKFGDTKKLLESLAGRDDWKDTIEHYNDTDEGTSAVFDARDFLKDLC